MATLAETINNIGPLDKAAMQQAALRQDNLTKPRGSLGRLEELSIRVAGITGRPLPVIRQSAIVTMAADHGVAARGVSLYPQEVTRQMVTNFLQGNAAVSILAELAGARTVTVDMGVKGGFPPTPGLVCKMIDFGTRDMCAGPAMTRRQAEDSIQAGIDIIEGEIAKGLDLVGTGDMGIGNTTAASAIIAAITGTQPAEVTGRGTGIDGDQLSHKVKTIEKALQVNKPDPADALDVLAKVGGFEIGGLAGLMLGAAAHRLPVVIDGFISGSAALIATTLCSQAKDYLIASHLSAENGHGVCLQRLGLKPLLDLDLRLGEGTGSALGIFLVRAAVQLLVRMKTFEEAGVSDKPGGSGEG
jgi:nicotinate-nucleotide--dimethylbenzimidazole phosphoribosyltransferase